MPDGIDSPPIAYLVLLLILVLPVATAIIAGRAARRSAGVVGFSVVAAGAAVLAAIALSFFISIVGSGVPDHPAGVVTVAILWFGLMAPSGLLTWGGLVCCLHTGGRGGRAALGVALIFSGLVLSVVIWRALLTPIGWPR
jgi:hypothetical protein